VLRIAVDVTSCAARRAMSAVDTVRAATLQPPGMATPLDFQAVFDASPNAYMVLDRELRYVAANPAYLRETGSRLDELLGSYVFDKFPHDPDDPNNAPARMLERSLERVRETGQRDHLALIRYRVPKQVDGAIVIEDRFWSATHTPLLDDDGRVAFIVQHTVDVTELHAILGEGEVRGGASAASEIGVLSRARAVQQANERIEAKYGDLQALFEQAPGFMAYLEGRDFVFTLTNRAYLEVVGRADILGKPVREALPEVAAQGFLQLLEEVFTTGRPFIGSDVRILLQRSDSGPPDERFLDFVYQPVRDDSGAPRGIFVQGHDVTARKVAEREREAAHRTATAFSEELLEQSRIVKDYLDRANARIAELEAQLARE